MLQSVSILRFDLDVPVQWYIADTVHKIKGFRLSRDWSIIWQKQVAASLQLFLGVGTVPTYRTVPWYLVKKNFQETI
jgi:hypothetical protein